MMALASPRCVVGRRASVRKRRLATSALLALSPPPTTTAFPAAAPRPRRDGPVGDRRRRKAKVAPLNAFLAVKDEFDARRRRIEDFAFQTLDAFSTTAGGGAGTNGRGTSPSRLYTYAAFLESLRAMSVGGVLGDAYHRDSNQYVPGYDGGNDAFADDESNTAFYVSQDDPERANAARYGVVNACAFLANAMAESIQFDACEELNGMVYGGLGGGGGGSGGNDNDGNDGDELLLSDMGGVNGRYFPMANACGQLGRSYDDEECPSVVGGDSDGNEVIVDPSCPADPDLEVTAVLHPRYNYDEDSDASPIGDQPPPPFYCMPKQFEEDYAGYWDGYDVEFVRRVAYPSVLGKIDVQGCCYWGRGALMTRGTCGLGRVNHFMGKKAYDEGRPARYPEIDFCRFPSIICGRGNALLSGVNYPELKFMVALFDWVDRVQSYYNDETRWDYLDQLRSFVDGGSDDDSRFIEAVSGVVVRGCDGRHCSGRTIPFLEERKRNFGILVRGIFNITGIGDPILPVGERPGYDFEHAMGWLNSRRSRIEGNVLVSRSDAVLGGVAYHSREYLFEPLAAALRTVAYYGVGEQRRFFLSDEEQGPRGLNAGLVNLAFFLANAMAESITIDSCNEVHWWNKDGQYAISNSCGQNGRNYDSETCPAWQSFMTCAVDKEAEIEAAIPSMAVPPYLLDAQPPPFQCKPGTYDVGYYDGATQTLWDDTSFFNSFGRTDVEGCCFWGRGALLTRGVCNYGKLNFHIGAQAAAENRPSLYPEIDFCSNPEAVCEDETTELRYVVAMFEWIDRVQDYYDSTRRWSYREELYKFVDGGMDNDVFVDHVSSIVDSGCHAHPCASASSIDTDRFLYGLERRMNFKNIIKLVFELPVVPPTSVDYAAHTPEKNQNQFNERQTPSPTLKPTPYPFLSMQLPTKSPLGSSPPTASPITMPTRSPREWSDVTFFGDGKVRTINSVESSYVDESIVVTKNTVLAIEKGGYIEAPLNTDWPAVRLSIGSTFIGRGGYINGSYANTLVIEGEHEDGGDAIHVNNGQSSPETASRAEFYDGVYVMGGNAPSGVGGNSLRVNGFGTEAIIYGGNFIGGFGVKGSGLSVHVLNSARVHVRGGTFQGEMKVERGSILSFYGCFLKDGTQVTGVFPDESRLDATVRTYYGGEIILIPVADQECETAPSSMPTNFPTLSPKPTVPRNHGVKRGVSGYLAILAALVPAFLVVFE